MKNKPKVSILCITYNHAKFIRDALNGFVMQKTNFPFEVLIHDDASTDGTADIIREYEKKYPDIIKPIYQTENQYSKGRKIISRFLWPRIQGEYVALNEGDDYWTDENKLQKQVDFLDVHSDCAICFHPIKMIWEDKREPEHIFPEAEFRFNKNILTLQDLLKHNFIPTCSVMYRWYDISNEWPKCDFIPGDYMMHLLQAQYGRIGFLPDVMSVYRRHSGGVWTGAMKSDEWFNKCTIPFLRFYQEVEKKFHVDKTAENIKLIKKATKSFVKNKKNKEIEQIATEFPDLWNKYNFLKRKKIFYRISIYSFCVLLLVLIFLLLFNL